MCAEYVYIYIHIYMRVGYIYIYVMNIHLLVHCGAYIRACTFVCDNPWPTHPCVYAYAESIVTNIQLKMIDPLSLCI